MEVILLDDVDRVGHEGDVLEVADGYARNYLIPRSLAVRATKGALRDLENRRTSIEERETERRARAQKLADRLATEKIKVTAPSGEGQRIHGQVTTQMISDAVAEQLDTEIDRRDIDIPEPIRELGDYLISAQIYKDVTAQLPISVVPQEGEEEAEAAEQAEAEEAEEGEGAETEQQAQQEPEHEEEAETPPESSDEEGDEEASEQAEE